MRRTEAQIRQMLDDSANKIHALLPFKSDEASVGAYSLIRRSVSWEMIRRVQAQEVAESGDVFASKGIKPGIYVSLVEGCIDVEHTTTAWMSTFPTERETNVEFLMKARGHVLVAGLGIGLILGPLLELKEVYSVTVIERQAEVIGLMRQYVRGLPYSNKLRIILGDVFTWMPDAPFGFDTIFFDIWPKIYLENLREIWKLKARFKPLLEPGGWMGAWVEDELTRRLGEESKKLKEKKRHETLYRPTRSARGL